VKVVEYLLSKHKALSLNPRTTNKQTKTKTKIKVLSTFMVQMPPENPKSYSNTMTHRISLPPVFVIVSVRVFYTQVHTGHHFVKSSRLNQAQASMH
jgi:hypothetical protein